MRLSSHKVGGLIVRLVRLDYNWNLTEVRVK